MKHAIDLQILMTLHPNKTKEKSHIPTFHTQVLKMPQRKVAISWSCITSQMVLKTNAWFSVKSFGSLSGCKKNFAFLVAISFDNVHVCNIIMIKIEWFNISDIIGMNNSKETDNNDTIITTNLASTAPSGLHQSHPQMPPYQMSSIWKNTRVAPPWYSSVGKCKGPSRADAAVYTMFCNGVAGETIVRVIQVGSE